MYVFLGAVSKEKKNEGKYINTFRFGSKDTFFQSVYYIR